MYPPKAKRSKSSLWLDALVQTPRDQAGAERQERYLHASHLIEAIFAVGPRERDDDARYVADPLLPIT